MGQRLTIHEVRENIEYVLERIQNQSENYTLDKITKSLEKVEEKYNKAYADYCVSKNCLNARKAKSLATRKKLLFYTKLIMEATCSSCIKDLNEIDIDLDKLSVRVLQKADKLGYRDYMFRRIKTSIKKQ